MSIKVFYCYAREDKSLRTMLEKHLANLHRQKLITSWSDRDIDAGKEWEKEIDNNLNTADIILLLISPDFMASEYCYSVEMKRALEREKNGTARVVPVIVRHIEYEGAPFSYLEALPTGATPVTDRKWNNRDAAFLDVAQGIRKIVKELLSKQCLDEGYIYYYRQQYENALIAFEQAINYDPNNVLAYMTLLGNFVRTSCRQERSQASKRRRRTFGSGQESQPDALQHLMDADQVDGRRDGLGLQLRLWLSAIARAA